MNNPCTTLSDPRVALYFREQFRAARAQALKDAEGFQEIIFVLERLGVFLTNSIGDLGKYMDCINEVAGRSPLANEQLVAWHSPFIDIYKIVKDGRNDALHQGAFARHLTSNTIKLALVLEDALMEISNPKNVRDYMVREPVCAILWQPVSFVRQQMLANSFTYLPISHREKDNPKWGLISDYGVAKYLRTDSNAEKKKRLARTVAEVFNKELVVEDVTTCSPTDTIDTALEKSKGKPVLVVDGDNLVGIVTPFDIL